tara:strand:- start:136 stop:429 length:294 start_codon:yes stop_codon:yes gene_type:complete
VSKPSSLRDYIFICFLNGKWWRFEQLQKEIEEKVHRKYDHTSISASIREIRHYDSRVRYGLPLDMSVEVVDRRKVENSNAYEYKLSGNTEELRRKFL